MRERAVIRAKRERPTHPKKVRVWRESPIQQLRLHRRLLVTSARIAYMEELRDKEKYAYHKPKWQRRPHQ